MPHQTRQVTVIQHLAFEDLGSLEAVLLARGMCISNLQAGVDDIAPAIEQADLVIILGGPIGVYEQTTYPFLVAELQAIQKRVQADRPTLGICLGAQLMAQAAGGRVYPGGVKEIGWSTLALSTEGQASALRHLQDTPVLHWHGDTFDLPPQAQRLASSAHYTNQAFQIGPNLLGLQFHPEVQSKTFERWLIGHAAELASAKVDVPTLRAQGDAHATGLEAAGQALFRQWLDGLRWA
jgi:GMP synthase (glutamine-hydrolysing)